MKRKTAAAFLAVSSALAISAHAAGEWRMTSEQTVGGFKNPESVGCDPKGKVLYVSNFEEVAEGFGGLQVHRLAGGELDRHELARAMAMKVLGRGWHYEVVQRADGQVNVVITGRS
ncbi:MAG TPA: hypothetical protein VN929_06970 [Burkholderiales bacterium]|nr:hypothetical protein [Burkholderiales bacterium]